MYHGFVGNVPGDICSCDNHASFACHQIDFCYDGGSDHPLNESGYVNTYHKSDYGCDMNVTVNVTQSSYIEDMNEILIDCHTGRTILTWIAYVHKNQTLTCSGSSCMNVNASCCYLRHDCTSHGIEIDSVMTHLMKLLQEEAEAAAFVVVVVAAAAAVAAVVVVVEAVAAAAAAVVAAAAFSSFSFLNLMYHSHCQFWGLWVVPTQWVY